MYILTLLYEYIFNVVHIGPEYLDAKHGTSLAPCCAVLWLCMARHYAS